MRTTNHSAVLARNITWDSSKQSFLTACLLADWGLKTDCLRAYAYFRWVDDILDCTLSTREERWAFIVRQKELAMRFYRKERVDRISAEESMLADLISNDRNPGGGLYSYIWNFFAVMEFDAGRGNTPPPESGLNSYSHRLAVAVMDGLQYFIGNTHDYPNNAYRCRAVFGAHLTHMLRDFREDLRAGVVNIPKEVIERMHLDLREPDSKAVQGWVREQVHLARRCFREGKQYIESLDSLRCQLAGHLYCARFERVLDVIEKDGFRLRERYDVLRSGWEWFRMTGVGIAVIWQYVLRKLKEIPQRLMDSQDLATEFPLQIPKAE